MTSKQQDLQVRWRREGLCVICGQPAAPSKKTFDGYGSYCEYHLLMRRKKRRAKKNGNT